MCAMILLYVRSNSIACVSREKVLYASFSTPLLLAKVHKSVGIGRERVVKLYASYAAECTKIHTMLANANRFMNFRHIYKGVFSLFIVMYSLKQTFFKPKTVIC